MVDICAVTCYFNPAREPAKLRNFRHFSNSIRSQIPLVAVEGACDSNYDLHEADADRVIRTSGDIMWQKERLLNIGLEHIRNETEMIVWLDCDILFEREDWCAATIDALRKAPIAQLFDSVKWRNPVMGDGTVDVLEWGGFATEYLAGKWNESDCRLWVRGSDVTTLIGDGYAWAARSEVLRNIELYDAQVFGAGTRTFCLAAFGEVKALLEADWLTAAQVAHIRPWAERLADIVAGNVSVVQGAVSHMWHGDVVSRGYQEREYACQRFEFDPSSDISHDIGSAWVWNTPKPEMHSWLKQYFNRRKIGAQTQWNL